MGLDDACNTCLVLGLGFPTTPETPPTNPPPAMAAPATSFEPFLTLGLSGECCPLTVTEKGDVNKGGSLHHRHHEELPTSAGAGDLCRPASPDVHHRFLVNQKQALSNAIKLETRQVEVLVSKQESQETAKGITRTQSTENGLHTNIPAATLTMCPSCERTGGDGNPNKPFSMSSKPRFYNHVTNPSAAW
ncbi:hypothetical protein GQ457_06G044180 [Hibiscus cannabinus]